MCCAVLGYVNAPLLYAVLCCVREMLQHTVSGDVKYPVMYCVRDLSQIPCFMMMSEKYPP